MGTRNTNVGTPRFNNHDNSKTNIHELRRVKSAIFELIGVVGGIAPSPTGLATLAEQQTQTSELLAANGTLLSILNNMIASQDVEILLVRDTGNADQVIQVIREYDQGTGLWSTSYADVNNNPYVPVGPLEYLDPSAVLNLMLTELQNILTELQGTLDVNVTNQITGFSTELTLQATNTLLTAIDTVLDNIKLDTANLDVALSTVATEATLAAIETLLTTLNSTDFATEVTLAALSSKFNTLGQKVSAASAPVVLSTEQEQILADIETAVSGLDTSTLATETTLQAVETLLTAIDAVLDTIKLDTANLDVALSTLATEATLSAIETLLTTLNGTDFATETTLSSIDTKVDLLATEAKQDDTIAKLQEILDEPDYEVIQCFGRDTDALTGWTMVPNSQTVTQFVAGVFPAPGVGVVPTWDAINHFGSNNAYYVEVTIDVDFSSTNIVTLFSDVTYLSGSGVNGITLELRDTGTSTLLATVTGMNSVPVSTTETFQLSFDNSTANYPSLKLRLYTDTLAGFFNFALTNWQYVTAGSVTNPDELIIRRVDKFEDNVIQSTDYFDYQDNPYTLIGTFLKDSSIEATALLSQSLSSVVNLDVPLSTRASIVKQDEIITEITKLTSHNTFTEALLPQAALSDLYSNFKEVTFTVINGTVDVTVGAGSPVTYPVGPVQGNTYTADDLSITNISIDRTNGDYLVTVKS